MENQQEKRENTFTMRDFEYWLGIWVMEEGYEEEKRRIPDEFFTFNPLSDPPGPYEELPEPPEPDWSKEPKPEEPDWDDFPRPEYPLHDTVEQEVDGTRVVVSTECGGTERLDEKVKRLILSEQEEN